MGLSGTLLDLYLFVRLHDLRKRLASRVSSRSVSVSGSSIRSRMGHVLRIAFKECAREDRESSPATKIQWYCAALSVGKAY